MAVKASDESGPAAAAGRTGPDRGISVVIPVRDAGRTLAEQLQAIAAADPPPGGFEVIVSDNGSSDDTAVVAASFESRMAVRVVDASEAPGSNYARNCGVRAAQHDRILLCDGDDRVDQQWLTAMSAAFDQGHRLVAGPIDYVVLNPASARAWRGADRASTGPVLNFLGTGHGANLGFSRSVWQDLGGFDESFEFGGPDIEFCWRAQLQGTPLHTVPEAIVHYRLRTSLSKLFSQSRAYGAAEAHLFREFADAGLRRRPFSAPLRDLWWIVTRLPFALNQGRRGAWLRRVGQQIGRVEGSRRYRVVWW